MIIEISVVVIAAFIVICVIGLLIVFVHIRRTAKEAEKFLDTVRQQIVPLSHDLTIILNDAKKIVQSIERQVGKVEIGVDAIKDTAINVKKFEQELQNKIEQPLLEVTALIAAIVKIIRGITDYFFKDRK